MTLEEQQDQVEKLEVELAMILCILSASSWRVIADNGCRGGQLQHHHGECEVGGDDLQDGWDAVIEHWYI